MRKKVFLTTLLVLLMVASCAFAGAQDFILVNKTGVEIYAVYIAPSETDNWEEDVLGEHTLPNGQSVRINFAPGTDIADWDIRAEDEDGDALEWYGFNLLRISRITLLGNGDAQYE